MAHTPIYVGMSGTDYMAALNGNFIPIDEYEDEGARVYPNSVAANNHIDVNTAFASNTVVKMIGTFDLYGTIVIPAGKILYLVPGTQIELKADINGIQLNSESRIIGNGTKMFAYVLLYSKSIIYGDIADDLYAPFIDGIRFYGLADDSGSAIEFSCANPTQNLGTCTFAQIRNCQFQHFNKAINLDMKSSTNSWCSGTHISEVIFAAPIYAIYLNNGGYNSGLIEGRKISQTMISNLHLQAGDDTKAAVYCDALESEIRMRTFDTRDDGHDIILTTDSYRNQVISETIGRIRDLGTANYLFPPQHTTYALEELAVQADRPVKTMFHALGYKLKLDASLNVTGNPVSLWGDMTPNVNDATEATNGPTWVDNVVNSLPVIRAVGTDLLTLTDNIILSRRGSCVFIVMKISTLDSTGRTLFGGVDVLSFSNVATSTIQMTPSGGTDWINVAGAGLGTADFFLLEIAAGDNSARPQVYSDTNLVQTLVNGVAKDSTSPDMDFTISNLFDSSFIGDVAEIIIYDQNRPEDYRIEERNTLMLKYNIS